MNTTTVWIIVGIGAVLLLLGLETPASTNAGGGDGGSPFQPFGFDDLLSPFGEKPSQLKPTTPPKSAAMAKAPKVAPAEKFAQGRGPGAAAKGPPAVTPNPARAPGWYRP